MDLITIKNCRVEDLKSVKVENVNWTFKTGEAWLVIGPNGSGKAEFLKALCSQLKIIPDSAYILVEPAVFFLQKRFWAQK